MPKPGACPGTSSRRRWRCAIYTRKSSEEGLEQDFNSLAAQRDACEAYIRSQAQEGWHALPARFDDGGFSGGTLERPALQALLRAIQARQVDIVVIYKIDRLSRSLMDFARLAEVFNAHQVSFVAVTQAFNTTTSMGRLMLNVLLSFAQFEREITGERIRDKIAASKQKGLWMGGHVPLGYQAQGRTLVPDAAEAETVRLLYRLYLEHGCVRQVDADARRLGLLTRQRTGVDGRTYGGQPFSRGHLYRILKNPLYVGRIPHKGQSYPGGHPGLVEVATWEAVQARLADNNLGHKTGRHARHPSLLAGLLVDAQGARFRATQGVKRGRTYRYYSHPAVITGDTPPRDLPIRHVPANDVEAAVLTALNRWLADPVAVTAAVAVDGETPHPAPMNRACRALQAQLKAATPERIILVRRLVPRIELRPERVQLQVDRGAVHELVGLGPPSHPRREPHVIDVPVSLRSRQGLLRLVYGSGGDGNRVAIDRVLIQTLARAYRWWEQIESGRYPSIQALANAEHLSSSFVTRVIRLAFLAPDIVAAITHGQQPPEVSARRLINAPALPSDWDQQRREYLARYQGPA